MRYLHLKSAGTYADEDEDEDAQTNFERDLNSFAAVARASQRALADEYNDHPPHEYDLLCPHGRWGRSSLPTDTEAE